MAAGEGPLSLMHDIPEQASARAIHLPFSSALIAKKRKMIIIQLSIRKKEISIMSRVNYGAKPIMLPQPVLIIATYDENGVPNAMNAAWGITTDFWRSP